MKEISKFKFDFRDLRLSAGMIEDVIGFNDGDDREFVRGMIDDILLESENIADVRAEYRIFHDIRFNDIQKTVSVNDTEFEIKKIVYGQLKKSGSLAIFICTAGKEVGVRSRAAMQERDFLRGYIFDVVGSEIVEAAADLMQNEIQREAGLEGKKITNRYSPGYCGWDVADQHKLFSYFPDNHCGITISESALMNPEKSVSGFIGLGEDVKMNQYACRICEMKSCIYRRIKEGRQ